MGYKLAFSKDGTYNSTYATNVMRQYAEELGLATKAGIEIYEETPHASSVNAIASAIGQGNHAYSCLNLARYVTTITTSGTCYNLTLIDKITDYEGNVLVEKELDINNVVEVSPSIWNEVHTGMKLAADIYPALRVPGLTIAAKTGTAQEKTTEPDHARIITYAPYEDPEIAMAISLPNGYDSTRATEVAADIYEIYFNLYPR